ncbi:carbohydrate ABC transporter permease [Paenibacillus paridis]|uniref:carbohydrate ABC transporter permease n=1 Tax=Paenibacillus paridis TaxID=2583376 RepID=UPI00192E5765|nr:carbohydrate ABC transporter permease [Paenibacillus paridis]
MSADLAKKNRFARFVKRLKRSKPDYFLISAFIGLTLLAVFMLLPLVFIVNHAFKPINELFMYPPRFLAEHPTLFNFRQLFLNAQKMSIPFSRYFFNSVFTTGVTVAAAVLISAMAAYAFSKHKFPGSSVFFGLIIISLMFAPEAVVIPRFILISELGIMNTYFSHIWPLVAMPVGVFLMRQFIDQIPNALIEAAKIDGAKEWKIFYRIVLPVCMPAVATVAILAFQMSWSQTETSNYYVQVESLKTLPYYVATLTGGLANGVVGQGIAAAASLMIFLPNLIIFLLFQRQVLMTMAHSGIK